MSHGAKSRLAALIMLLTGLAHAGPMQTSGQFEVTPSGAASYTIPIQVAPGTAGIEPKLALNYSSQSGNGLLGVGWNLSGLSAITRCPRTIVQDGIKSGINFDANDRYCMDGQRLIAVVGAYGANGTEYRTERESFSKIVSYGVAGNGPAWFKVWTKAGQIIEYGNTADSRIEAQGKASVRAWTIDKLSDTAGNYLTYTYTEDSANGDYYPQRIDYTGNANGLAPNNAIQFVYETRPDIITLYQAGSLIKSTQRLTKVQTYSGVTLSGEYRLTYANSAAPNNASRIVSTVQCDGSNTCQPATPFGWQTATGSIGFATPVAGFTFPRRGFFPGSLCGWTGDAVSSGCGTLSSADINGDGLADLVITQLGDTNVYISYSNGSGVSTPVIVGTNTSGDIYGTTAYATLGDVNGDGLADIILGNGQVMLSTGNGFAAARPWFTLPLRGTFLAGALCRDIGSKSNVCGTLSSADVNGDGLADLVITVAGDTNVYVSYSNGNGGSTPVAVGSNTSGDVYGTTAYATLGDVNGDGLADIILGNGQVMLSTGNGFAAARPWFTFPPKGFFPGSLCGWTGDAVSSGCGTLSSADVNGDGLADLVITVAGDTNVYVSYSNGNGGSTPASVGTNTSGDVYGTTAYATLGDVNGDGLADIILGSGYLSAATASTPNLVTQIANGLGGTANITYKPLTEATVYTADSGSAYPIRDLKKQGPLYVTSTTASSNGVGGTLTTAYTYGGAKVDLSGRGFLGFRWTQATNPTTGITARTDYRQDWPYVGLPSLAKKTILSGGNAGLLSQASSTFTCTNPQTGAACTVAAGNRYFPYASQSVESGWDLNGTALPVVTTNNQFDTWGNATQVSVSTGDGYSKTTTNTYTNDTTNWYLGRLLRSQVQSVTP